MAATVEEVGRPGGEPRSWIVNEGDRLIAVCYSRERAERVCAALNEVAALRAQVARVRALADGLERDSPQFFAGSPLSPAGKQLAVTIGQGAADAIRAALNGEGGA